MTTEELNLAQKAKNKAANAVRRKAHKLRIDMLDQAINAAAESPDVVKAKEDAERISEAVKAAEMERNEKISNLQNMIDEIKYQINDLIESEDVKKLHASERAAWDAWRSLKYAAIKEAEAEFKDLDGVARLSHSAWDPPQDVLDAMAAAREAID